jgi:O-antigen/teichoic acid export membrane protein
LIIVRGTERRLQRLGFTVAKNALANVVRGGATAVVALALPHYLTRALDHDRFAAWSLMLQIAAYAAYLDFGIQTAVARYLAQAIERGDHEQQDRLVSTAFTMLSIAGAVAFLAIAAVASFLPQLFHGVPFSLTRDLRMGVLIMGGSAALALPMSTFVGVLIGLHRNEYPAIVIGGSRMLGGLAVLAMVRYTNSLAYLALCVGMSNLVGSAIQYFIAKALLPRMSITVTKITFGMVGELAQYCVGLSVVSFAMLLISGLDITIVGYFNFRQVSAYAIASMFTTLVAGLSGSIFSALLAPLAVLQERSEYLKIRRLLIRTSELNSCANLAFLVFIFLAGKSLLRLWVGEEYASTALPILEILTVGQTIRLAGNPYGTVLVATGLQKYAVPVVLAEGFTNLFLSIWFARNFGAIGVALGTIGAALLGLALTIFMLMPRVKSIQVRSGDFLATALFKPLLVFSPLLALVASRTWLPHSLPSTGPVLWGAFMAAVAATLCLFYAFGTIGSQNDAI